MPVDVEYAEERVAANKLKMYYGYDPGTEYVLRSRSRRYNQTTHGYYRFVNGEVLVGRMRQDVSEEQRWARGERLKWFEQNPGYRIYVRSEQPTPEDEPMWRGQELPEEAALPDSGEEQARWEQAPSLGPLHADIETAVAPEPQPDGGELAPEPERRPRVMRAPVTPLPTAADSDEE